MLWIILSVFSATYMIRGIWDSITHTSNANFGLLMWSVLNGVLYDFIPIMLIMYFHYRNFSKEKVTKTKEAAKNKAKNTKSNYTYDNTSSVNGFDIEYAYNPSSDKLTLLDQDGK